jgi:hypothetical protein
MVKALFINFLHLAIVGGDQLFLKPHVFKTPEP